MPDDVVVGLQWGDEGKGKLVDERAPACAAVVRFQGGANAGHTVIAGGRRVILHQVPSGALHPGVRCIIGAGCVVDPAGLRQEVAGLGLPPARLVVSARAQVVLPAYRAIDAAEEALRDHGAVGTTRQGIGPAYAAKSGRWGLTVGQLVDPAARAEALTVVRAWLSRWVDALGLDPALAGADGLAELGAWLRPFAGDDLAAIAAARARGPVLFEGQLGLMRDPDRGIYPRVTGASLLPPAALLQPGTRIIGVAKPYVTAVGPGPLPTEADPADAALLREQGGEFGATTGRPRRCGWLDLPALRYAARAAGATHLGMQMKLDGLRALGRMRVCVAYAGWDEAQGYPLPHELAAARPVYEEWDPAADAVALAERVADAVGLPLAYVGTGAERGAAVWR